MRDKRIRFWRRGCAILFWGKTLGACICKTAPDDTRRRTMKIMRKRANYPPPALRKDALIAQRSTHMIVVRSARPLSAFADHPLHINSNTPPRLRVPFRPMPHPNLPRVHVHGLCDATLCGDTLQPNPHTRQPQHPNVLGRRQMLGAMGLWVHEGSIIEVK
jgi:hypothetical protein